MKINELILQNLIDIPEDIFELTNQYIVEVDSFLRGRRDEEFVVGKVLTCEKHPNADSLSLTTVDVGGGVIEKIVCGASNVRKDQLVVVAKNGARISDDFVIKPTKIRGEESNGMICSLQELGFDEKFILEKHKEGIFYFDEKVEIGTNAFEALYQHYFVMELDLTPNRGDLLSHLGYAYDLSAVTGSEVTLPDVSVKRSSKVNDIKVEIKTDNCLLYYASRVDVVVKESPLWLRNALLLSNIQPINNVVDITNYCLLLMGTPLHAFDAKKIGDEITIRQAKNKKKVITLDEIEREIDNETMVITSNDTPVALAGVMGLDNSKIDEQTTSIVLEAALFNPKNIQTTSKNLNLRSDSSLRFERGIDPKRVKMGLDLALKLLVDYADGVVYNKDVVAKNYVEEKVLIETSLLAINKKLGVKLTSKELEEIFRKYRYEFELKDETYLITPPTDRLDLKIEADIVEEVARLYGLNNIKDEPIKSNTVGKLSNRQRRIRKVRHFLSNLGLNEVITYSLVDEKKVLDFNTIGESIQVLRPLSDDRKILRQSLIGGLLDVLKYNNARQHRNVFIYEIGNVFAKDLEELHLSILASGDFVSSLWQNKKIQADFFLVKGFIDQLSSFLNVELSYERTSDYKNLHPLRQALIKHKGEIVGYIGQISPKYKRDNKLNESFVAELFLDKILKGRRDEYKPISKYPSIERDLAVVVETDLESDKIVKIIKQTARKTLTDVKVFDVFVDDKLGENKKSIAIKMIFNDTNKTLEASEIEKVIKKIIHRLSYELKAEIRQWYQILWYNRGKRRLQHVNLWFDIWKIRAVFSW